MDVRKGVQMDKVICKGRLASKNWQGIGLSQVEKVCIKIRGVIWLWRNWRLLCFFFIVKYGHTIFELICNIFHFKSITLRASIVCVSPLLRKKTHFKSCKYFFSWRQKRSNKSFFFVVCVCLCVYLHDLFLNYTHTQILNYWLGHRFCVMCVNNLVFVTSLL